MGGQGGDSYGQQRSDQGGYEYGQTGTAGLGGTQSDQTKTSGQYGGQERFQTSQSQTAGYADPTRVGGGGSQPEDDDDYGASVGPGGGPTGASRQSGTGKPSMTSRVKGTPLCLGAVRWYKLTWGFRRCRADGGKDYGGP